MGPFVFFEGVTHFGGSYRSTVLIIKEMQKYCDVIAVDIYGACDEYTKELKRYGIKTIIVKPNPIKGAYVSGQSKLARFIHFMLKLPETIDIIRRLRRIINDISPQAIWVNSRKALFFLSRAVGKRYPLAYYSRGENMYPWLMSRYDWRHISFIPAISECCLTSLRGTPYEASMMEVIPNGIDIDETVALASVKAANLPSGGGLKLIYAASLYEVKDQATAIRGLAEYLKNGGDASLWLCGSVAAGNSDAYPKELRKLAKDHNIEQRVYFLGWREDVPSVMAECDIVVLTSISEGFGRVLLEAMCLRKPVIATRVGGIPEVVRDGIDGILIKPKSAIEFAKAVEKLVDPKVRQQMGEAGFERVKNHYDIKKVASRFLDLINEIS